MIYAELIAVFSIRLIIANRCPSIFRIFDKFFLKRNYEKRYQ